MRDDKHFTWGKIEEEYEVGPYHIVEYRPWKYSAQTQRETEDWKIYHVYINGQDTSQGANTLDQALLVAIAHRSLGPHTHGLDMIYRALKLPEGTSK